MAQEAIEQTKSCTKCRQVKDLAEFPKCGGKYHRGDCRACNTAKVKAWQLKNPDRNREHRQRQYKRAAAARKLMAAAERSGGDLDAMRRLLVQAPPELSTEQERLAYFRGLMAGVKRNSEETERFERLKDLPHRIASESAMKAGIGYEEAISAAYEGLLVFLRGHMRSFASAEHERKYAAKKIRWHIGDYKRAEGPQDRRGNLRWVGSQAPENEDGADLMHSMAISCDLEDDADMWKQVDSRLSGHPECERLRAILRMKMNGYSQREISDRIGLSQSSISKLLSQARPWLEKHIVPLCGDALAS